MCRKGQFWVHCHFYINDLPNCSSSSQPRMYADDTHLTFASDDINTIDEALNRDLDLVNNWLISNKEITYFPKSA